MHARVLFLDIDGVLNRTGFRPEDPGADLARLAAWIEPELAARLTQLVAQLGAFLVLSSDWRIGRTLVDLQLELVRAGVDAPLRDVTPVLAGRPRWREIAAWLEEAGVAPTQVVILDDLHEMGELAARHVRIDPRRGLDDGAVAQARSLATPHR